MFAIHNRRRNRMRKLTCSESTLVGKQLAQGSAATLKKLWLEPGGNAPFIVFDDTCLAGAVTGLLATKFSNGGQTCACQNRVYVQAGVYAQFGKMLVERVAALKGVPATTSDAQICRMNVHALNKIAHHVDNSIGLGARVLTEKQT